MERRTLACVGLALLVVLAGCSAVPGVGDLLGGGSGDATPANGGGSGGGDGGGDGGGGDGGDGGSGDGSANGTATPPAAERFAFPPGTSPSGVDSVVYLSRVRETLAGTERYRVTQQHTIQYREQRRVSADGRTFEYDVVRTDALNVTYDLGREGILERRTRPSERVRVDRWVTADRVLGRSTSTANDRGGTWVADTAYADGFSERAFQLRPFAETSAAGYLRSAGLQFQGIVTRDGRPFAKYAGSIERPESVTAREFNSVRLRHQVRSVSNGSVTVLVGESGLPRSVSYQFTGEVARLTPDGPEVKNATVEGQVGFRYRNLSAVSRPGWANSTDGFREFDVEQASGIRGYRMVSDTTLPGAEGTTDTEFLVSARFGDTELVASHLLDFEFDRGSTLFVVRRGDDLDAGVSTPRSGQNALDGGATVRASIYLTGGGQRATPVYYERLFL